MIFCASRIGDRIQCACRTAGRDRVWLAERLHESCSPALTVESIVDHLEQIADGSRSSAVHVTELAAMAKALGCSLLYLMGVDDK